MKKRPNKAPEPTPTSDTKPANEGKSEGNGGMSNQKQQETRRPWAWLIFDVRQNEHADSNRSDSRAGPAGATFDCGDFLRHHLCHANGRPVMFQESKRRRVSESGFAWLSFAAVLTQKTPNKAPEPTPT